MRLLASEPGGKQRSITIEIGRPYAIGAEEAACSVAIAGLVGKLHDVHGVDTLQALALAVKLVRALLTDFVENGGRLTRPDGTEIDLAAHFGG